MSRKSFRALLPALIALLPLSAGRPLVPTPDAPSSMAQDPPAGGDKVAELVTKLKNTADAADAKLITELGSIKTRAAMQGLLEVYKAMSTIFMRREVVRALVNFDGVPDAEQPALQKLMDVATQSSEIELRTAAIDALGGCPTHGKDFLVMIVNSAAEDSLREKAMSLHVKLHDKNDLKWYSELYKFDEKLQKADKEKEKKEKKEQDKKEKKEKKGKDDKKEDEAPPPPPTKVRRLNTVRLMAFEALSGGLKDEQVVGAADDAYHKIREAALLELERRKDRRALEIATDLLDKLTPTNGAPLDHKVNEYASVRLTAAQVIARLSGTKVAADFIKRALNVDTPMELRKGLAEILAGFNDPAVNKDLVNELGKGREHEKMFQLWAVRNIKDERIDKALVKMLADLDPKKEGDVVAETCHLLADRKYTEAIPALQKLVGPGKDRFVARAALDAMAVLRVGDPKWTEELIALTKSDDPDMRNLGLQALGGSSDKTALPKLVEALNDKNWSTRLAALDALEHMRTKEAMSPIIERMAKEEGRMLQEFANALWRMTGQPYQDNAKGWGNWWKDSSERFVFVTEADLQKVRTGEEEWRLKQSTRVETKFFGIRIISHRVVFIIDVSGSMVEGVASEYMGKVGQTRMEIAKSELRRCISGLDPTALFNIVTFSTDVNRWIDGSLAAANEKNREDAKAYVDKLGPFGGTNLYGAVQEAFKDPDVDTIFIMSDGEPSVGDETDPLVIREHIKQWNEHRGIVINTIAVGGQFQVLEWVAEDSGGTHIKFE